MFISVCAYQNVVQMFICVYLCICTHAFLNRGMKSYIYIYIYIERERSTHRYMYLYMYQLNCILVYIHLIVYWYYTYLYMCLQVSAHIYRCIHVVVWAYMHRRIDNNESIDLYVSMCNCMYVLTRKDNAYICFGISENMYTRVFIHKCFYISSKFKVYTYVLNWANVYVCVCVYACMSFCVYVYMCAYVCLCICISSYIDAYVHSFCTYVFLRRLRIN